MTIAAKMIREFENRFIKRNPDLYPELSTEDIRKQILIAKYMDNEDEIKEILYNYYKCPTYCIELDEDAQGKIAHILGKDMQYGGGREMVDMLIAIGFNCQLLGAGKLLVEPIEATMSVDF